jgi:flagellar hook-associated protein 1 FlgK
MAEGLSDEVNAVLAAGYDLDGNSPGKPLFEFTSTSTTSMLKVTDGLLAKELAFSASATEQGDSTQLHALIGLEALALNINALGTVRLGDAMTQLVGKLGVASQQNLAARGTAQTVRDQSEESWKSTSGVNQDEEAINLIRYQQMYQSNMKVIAVANELFDSTLAMM